MSPFTVACVDQWSCCAEAGYSARTSWLVIRCQTWLCRCKSRSNGADSIGRRSGIDHANSLLLIPGGGESSRRYQWGSGCTSPAATPCRVSWVVSMRAPCQGHSPLACSLGPLSQAESPKLVRSRSPHLRVPRGHCPLSDLKRSSKREEELKQAKVWSEYRLPKRVIVRSFPSGVLVPYPMI